MTKKKCGKSKIIQDVRATGLTARKAEKAVNTVFDHLKLGLWWGELLGKPVNKVVMVMLQEAVKTHPFKRETLLQRLREFKDRGERFDGVVSLARQLAHPSCL